MVENKDSNERSIPFILVYRIALAMLGAGTLLLSHYLNMINSANASYSIIIINLRIYRYFTMQTNLMVIIWLILAIVWSSDREKMQKLMGKLKGALTLYITVTFIIFAIVLNPLYHPSGIDGVINLMVHYVIPVGFIIDWLITEYNEYEWKTIPYWLIYPICYLIYALLHGGTLGEYLYPFLNLDTLGLSGLVFSVVFLILFFIGLSSIFIAVSRRFLPLKAFSNYQN